MQRIRAFMITVGLLTWLSGSGLLFAQTQQDVFTSPTSLLDMPEGIAIDAAGNIVSHSNGVAVTQLIQFAPTGLQLIAMPVGNAGPIDSLRFQGSRIDTDPVTGRLYLLSPNGDILSIDPLNLTEIPDSRIDIRTLAIDVTSVFDVNDDSTGAFTFGLETVYGDIAVFHSQLEGEPELLELFLTGFSDGLPFVMRLQLNPDTHFVEQAKIVLTSTAHIPISLSAPRGVAINSQGIGLTTLPLSAPTSTPDCPDMVIAFNHDFSAGDLPFILPNSSGTPSWGMTSDANDNFYLATGGVGNLACVQAGNAMLITIPQSFSPIIFDELSVFPPEISRPHDVAVGSPLTAPPLYVYMTISTSNAIVRFVGAAPLLPATLPGQ